MNFNEIKKELPDFLPDFDSLKNGLETPEAHRETIFKILRNLSFSDDVIEKALEANPDGRLKINNVTYCLDAETIYNERVRQYEKTILDYYNEYQHAYRKGLAIGKAEVLVSQIQKLQETTQKPLEEVLQMLRISQSEYDQSLALLNQ